MLLVINVLIINYYTKTCKKNKIELEDAIVNEANIQNRLTILHKNLIYAMESEDCYINRNSIVIDINGDSISLSSVLKPDKRYLVFRYSYSSCSNCISQITQFLFQYKDSISKTEILLLPHYLTYRDLIVQNASAFNKAFRIFMPINNQIGLPIDKEDVPYLFFIDDGRMAKQLIVADPSEIEVLVGYLKTFIHKDIYLVH